MILDDRPPLDDVLIDLIGQLPLPLSIERLSDKALIYLSPGFTGLFGYTLEDTPTYEAWFQKAYPDPRYRQEIDSKLRAMTKAVLRGENPAQNIIAKVTCKNGVVRQIGFSASVSRGHMVAFFKDVTERVEAEEALRESERYNRMLFESSPVGLALNRMDGTFVDVNAAFARIIGFDVDKILSRDYWELTPEEYAEEERALLAELIETGRFGPYQKEYFHEDGHRVPVRLNGVLIERAGEKYIWSSVEDVSDLKATENSLRDSEQRERARATELETLLDSIPISVFIAHDAECKYVTGNRVAQDMVGLPKDTNPSKTPPEGAQLGYKTLHQGVEIAPEDLPMQLAASTGEPVYEVPITISRADGSERETLGNAAPLFDAQGNPRGAVGVFIDITEQLKVEKALRESEQRERARAVELETVIEQVPLPVFISYDPKCSIMTGNQAAYELIGIPKGTNPSLTAPEGQRPNYRTLRNGVPVALYDHPMHRAAALGLPVIGDALTIIWEDGTERQSLNNAAPLFDSEGKVRGAVGVSIDITEQLEVKKALEVSLEQARAAKEQLQFQFKHLPVAYIVWDREFRVAAWNPAAERVFGWTSEEAVGRHAYDLMAPPSVQTKVDAAWDKIIRGGGTMEYSMNENITRDGREIICEWFNAPLRDKQGNVVSCLSMVHDISDRITTERELQLAAEVFESCREAIVVSDGNSRILTVNAAFTKVTGYTPEEAVGQNSTFILAESLAPDWAATINKALDSTGHWQGEFLHRRKNGEVYPSLLSISAVKDDAGNIINRIGFFLDMTERMAAETAVRRRTDQMVLVTDALPFMVAYIDDRRRFTFINQEFEKVHEISRGDALGQRFDVVLPKALANHCHPQIEAGLLGKRAQYEEVVLLPRDGPCLCRSIFLPHLDNGKVLGVFVIIEDITEQRKAEDHLRQSQKLQSLGTLAGGISHDLNNLLTPIIGLTGLVLDDLGDDDNAHSLQDVLSAAERAQRLVGQILAFSRKEAPNRQELSLAPLIEETVKLIRVALPSSVVLTMDIQAASPVLADDTQIQQIIMNLCSNAAHAMGLRGGELFLSLRSVSPKRSFYKKHPGLRRGEYVEMVVRDTGCGMNQHTLSRIFEPFFTTKVVGEGTGMGLSVVHGIISAHQGAIEVESELEQGTAFRIFLPAVAD